MKRILLFSLAVLLLSFGVHARTLSPEEKLTRRKCSSCHIPPKQGKYTEQELWTALKTHNKQLGRLSEDEKTIIVNYLKKL